MAIVTLAALALLVVLAFLLVATVVTSGRPGRPILVPAGLADQARHMRSRAHARVIVSGAAVLVAGIVSTAGVLALSEGQSVWVIASLVAAGAGCIAVAALGPRRESAPSVRSAELTPRVARSFGPRWAFTAPALLALVLAVAMVLTAFSATVVDGESVLTWHDESGPGSVGPYPGWSTVLPMLVLLTLAAATFAMALRRVASWPRPIEHDLFGLDDDIRRATTRMLLFGATGALLVAVGDFGAEVAGAWETALLNQRLDPQPGALSDPTPAESVWHWLQGFGFWCVLLGFVLMLAAAAAGRVRRPLLADRVVSSGDAEVVG